jgi:hypothetical protein
MHQQLVKLQLLLLDLLGTHRPISTDEIAKLNDEDWLEIMEMAGQHRLKPLLYWRLQHEHQGLPVPAPILTELADSFKRSSVRQMMMQRELILTVRALNQAGIPNLALKGAYLAYYAYPHPALRPLRDLDILVPTSKAINGFNALLAQGWQRSESAPGSPSAWLETLHHLPGLSSASGSTLIEIHHQLAKSEHLPDIGIETIPELWESALTQSIAGTDIQFMAIPHLLLHLIEHAVNHHQFDNGSLFISDLAYLFKKHDIDWKSFWVLAERYQQVRASCLSLLLVEYYYGPQPIVWPNSVQKIKQSAQEILIRSARLTLRKDDFLNEVSLNEEINTAAHWLDKLSVVWERIVPDKKTIIMRMSLSSETPTSYYRFYLNHWWRLLTNRLPSLLRNRFSQHANRDLENLKTLKRWLKS